MADTMIHKQRKRFFICFCVIYAAIFLIGPYEHPALAAGTESIGIFPESELADEKLRADATTNEADAANGAGSSAEVDLSEEIDLSEVRGFFNQLDQEIQESMPEFSLGKIFENIKNGQFEYRFENIGRSILSLLLKEVVTNAPLIAKLLVLAVICAVINQLQTAFTGNISKVAQMMAYLVLLALAITSFRIAVDVGTEAIDKMVSFMQIVLPAMYMVLMAMGNLTSTALFKPIVMGSLAVLATVIKTVVLPLFFFSIVLKLFNNISAQFKLSKLASLLEFCGKLGIGIVMTVFIGVMTVQGVTGGVADGVTLRTAKYSADLIPVVGKFFKDAVEIVVSSGLLLKSALGIAALIAILIITLLPVIKIVAMMFTFKLAAALVEPLGEKELADSLQDMAKGLMYVFMTIASVGIMFFMTIVIVTGAGSLAVMLR
ncbi:stage III sporulation protein AE [Dehalobacter sp. DCM]|uniref:stage III sporulation protein AE n=1 Tax=Dehalobacter sp. DCM TaxID=2907827 RepID=UPI003081BFED|nr:stage III sporulation protein AE [Dehalobacter sp. DCM]